MQGVFASLYPAGWPGGDLQTVLGNGIAITSTAKSALNGTYALDPTSRSDIIAVETSIAAGVGLPGGGSTFIYLDSSGSPHSFLASDFTNFAVAVRNFYYACVIAATTAAATMSAANYPSNAVTIP